MTERHHLDLTEADAAYELLVADAGEVAPSLGAGKTYLVRSMLRQDREPVAAWMRVEPADDPFAAQWYQHVSFRNVAGRLREDGWIEVVGAKIIVSADGMTAVLEPA